MKRDIAVKLNIKKMEGLRLYLNTQLIKAGTVADGMLTDGDKLHLVTVSSGGGKRGRGAAPVIVDDDIRPRATDSLEMQRVFEIQAWDLTAWTLRLNDGDMASFVKSVPKNVERLALAALPYIAEFSLMESLKPCKNAVPIKCLAVDI